MRRENHLLVALDLRPSFAFFAGIASIVTISLLIHLEAYFSQIRRLDARLRMPSLGRHGAPFLRRYYKKSPHGASQAVRAISHKDTGGGFAPTVWQTHQPPRAESVSIRHYTGNRLLGIR